MTTNRCRQGAVLGRSTKAFLVVAKLAYSDDKVRMIFGDLRRELELMGQSLIDKTLAITINLLRVTTSAKA